MNQQEMNRFKPSALPTKIIVSVVLIALLVCMYLYPVAITRMNLDIITRSATMDYASAFFILVFLAAFLIIYYLLPNRKLKNISLYIASLIFIGWGCPYYIILALVVTGFTYILGKSIYKDINKDREYQAYSTMRFGTLLHALIIIGFGLSNSYVSGIRFMFDANFNVKSLAVPVGIVIYCLHGISYLRAVYDGLNVGKVKYLDVSLYMIMFPRLLVGPYEGVHKIISQIRNRRERLDLIGEGAKRFIKGILKKLVIANNIFYLFNRVSEMNHSEVSALTAWLGAFALVFAIYFALSGYTDMAIGLGKMMGFSFKENFKEPFKARSVVELKNRYMASAFSWLREYVYVPITMKSNMPAAVSVSSAIICVMIFVTTLGTGGRFLVAAIFFSLIVALEYSLKGPAVDKKRTVWGLIYTKIIMAIGAVIMGSNTIVNALYYLKAMFFMNGIVADKTGLYYLRTYAFIFILLILISTPSIPKKLLSKIGGKR